MPEIDSYSLAAIRIELLFDKTELGQGTGFFWKSVDHFYLVTNWHVLSGRNPETGRHLDETTAAEPNKIKLWLNQKGKLGTKLEALMPLRDAEGRPNWLVHPKHREKADVAILRINIPADIDPYPINELASSPVKYPVGSDVFILGYPLKKLDFFPIWKRGSIASEPQVDEEAARYITVDSASRPGMSGSPVIRRVWGAYSQDGGPMKIEDFATRFIGIYSGRLEAKDALAAQLGMVWPRFLVEEIVAGGLRDE